MRNQDIPALIRSHARSRNPMIRAPSSPELSMASTRRSPAVSRTERHFVRMYCQSVAMYLRISAALAGRRSPAPLTRIPSMLDMRRATSVATTRTICRMLTTRFTALAGQPFWYWRAKSIRDCCEGAGQAAWSRWR